MSETCPNCAKPVLASDTTCWHCGTVLPKRAKPKAADSPPTVARVGPLSRERVANATPTPPTTTCAPWASMAC